MSAPAFTVVVDSREQRPWVFPDGVQVVRRGLPCGDYTVKGFGDWDCPRFVCERKELNDLIGSLTHGRARFMRSIEKLRAFGFAAILIEASRIDVETGAYISSATPQSVLASLDAISVRANVHVYWCGDADGAAAQFLSLAKQFTRGIAKDYRRLTAAPAEDAA